MDLLPETDKNIYVCDAHARHLAAAIDEQRYHPIYNFYYGGVTALSTTNFQLINGFANRYAGWGNEDDDMSARTIGAGWWMSPLLFERLALKQLFLFVLSLLVTAFTLKTSTENCGMHMSTRLYCNKQSCITGTPKETV